MEGLRAADVHTRRQNSVMKSLNVNNVESVRSVGSIRKGIG
jgi:hypothetical protein